MRYVSIDIETTGLNPETDQILEFGAVIDDTMHPEVPVEELPTFRRVVHHRRIKGTPRALAMNARLLSEMSEVGLYEASLGICCQTGYVVSYFEKFLLTHGYKKSPSGPIEFVPAGKNFSGFDHRFLKAMTPAWDRTFRPSHRTLDPAILYFDPLKDEKPPSLSECLERAGLDSTVKHTAIEDARDVVRLLRFKFAERADG